MKKIFTEIVCWTAVCVLLNGCGQSGIDQNAFDKAQPEVRQTWGKAIAADKADDYVAASTNLVFLLNQDVTPEQLVAVQNALRGLNQRMHAAADKGDASAQKAVEELKTMQNGKDRSRR